MCACAHVCVYMLRKGLEEQENTGTETKGQKPSVEYLLTNAVRSDLFGNLKESPLSPPASQAPRCAPSPHRPRRNCKEREAHATSGGSVLVGSSAAAASSLGVCPLSEQTPAKEPSFQRFFFFFLPVIKKKEPSGGSCTLKFAGRQIR